jgi:hypothetical protein
MYKGERIPTLSEVFEAVGSKLFINVEINNYASPFDDLPVKVAELVKRHSLQDRVLFSSFFDLSLRRAHRIAKGRRLGGRNGAHTPGGVGTLENDRDVAIARHGFGTGGNEQRGDLICCSAQPVPLEKVGEGRRGKHHEYRQHRDCHHQLDQGESP